MSHRRIIYMSIILSCLFLTGLQARQTALVLKANNLVNIGGYTVTLLGAPKIVRDGPITAISFNGVNDGLLLPKNPIEGWPVFTVEALFKPDRDGPVEPRFVHFEDSLGNRCTLEIRITPEKRWYVDAFLKNGKTNTGLALIDPLLLHAPDKWYWIALTYDGKKMRSYVNGVLEHEGELAFPVSTAGNLAMGVRLNKVNWFKGAISELRFSNLPLAPSALQKIRE